MKSHPSNFCGGGYQGWLEVMLLPECNGRCAWCIERQGWHPTERATWTEMAQAIVATGKTHISLLGGEPTMYADLGNLLHVLWGHGLQVYLTSNAWWAKMDAPCEWMHSLSGLNLSLHHYLPRRNEAITGVHVDAHELAVLLCEERHWRRDQQRAPLGVRFNCNLIRGQIDSWDEAVDYVLWAQQMGATAVRFAELKQDEGAFVTAASIFSTHGLPEDPFTGGCSHDLTVRGVPVNVRLMCGLQTPCRPSPVNPEQIGKTVLYYDGHLYPGWQTQQESPMNSNDEARLAEILAALAKGDLTQEQAFRMVRQMQDAAKRKSSTHCGY